MFSEHADKILRVATAVVLPMVYAADASNTDLRQILVMTGFLSSGSYSQPDITWQQTVLCCCSLVASSAAPACKSTHASHIQHCVLHTASLHPAVR